MITHWRKIARRLFWQKMTSIVRPQTSMNSFPDLLLHIKIISLLGCFFSVRYHLFRNDFGRKKQERFQRVCAHLAGGLEGFETEKILQFCQIFGQSGGYQPWMQKSQWLDSFAVISSLCNFFIIERETFLCQHNFSKLDTWSVRRNFPRVWLVWASCYEKCPILS